jgi:hypothetical protein
MFAPESRGDFFNYAGSNSHTVSLQADWTIPGVFIILLYAMISPQSDVMGDINNKHTYQFWLPHQRR